VEEKGTRTTDLEDCGTTIRIELHSTRPEGEGTRRRSEERERRGDGRCNGRGRVGRGCCNGGEHDANDNGNASPSATVIATGAGPGIEPKNGLGVALPPKD
jgi:hypothetical protein